MHCVYASGCPSDLSSCMTTLIISNEEMNDSMKIVKSLEASGLSINGISETIKNKTKKTKKVGFSVCYCVHLALVY